MILKSIKTGFAQMWANKRMVLVYYLANFLFGLILVLPLRSVLNKFVGFSLMGAELGGRMNMDFLFEFLKHNDSGISAVKGLFLIVPLSYWLFSLFLSGGAFSIFASGEKYSPSLFWGNAAKYFGRFVRLVLWCVPVIAVLFCLQFIWSAIERVFFGSDPYQYVTYWGGWIKVGLRYISIILIALIIDYARIHAVLTDESKMRISVLNGILFSFKNLLQTFGLALLLFIIGAIVLVIYNPIADLLHAPQAVIIILLFLLQQLYMFFRMMLRLTKFSSQIQLYNAISSK